MKGAAGDGRYAARLPLLLTAILHLGALLLALIAPGLVQKHLQIPEVYQVELYSAPEPALKPLTDQPPIQTEAEITAITAQPPPTNKPAVVSNKPATPPRPKPQSKAISLSPIKQRLLKEKQEREEQANRDQLLADRMTKLKLDLQQQKVDEHNREAARLAKEAAKAIAETYRLTPLPRPAAITGVDETRARSSETATPPAAGTPDGTVSPEIQAAYKDRLKVHIGRHWSLPDLQGWDKSLKTVINIKMKANGMVAPGGVTIAAASGNPRFDKEARKAVNNALPLPPLPPEFGNNGEEIAVTFTPGGLK